MTDPDPIPSDPVPSGWRKSSRSGSSGGDCVEVSTGPARVAVRDSKDPIGPVLTFAPAAWRGFLAALAD